MRKDLKMGMITGVVIVTVATLIVSLLSPTPEARLLEEGSMLSSEIIQMMGPEDTADTVAVESEKVRYSVGPKIHIVKAGETLSTISNKYYGTTDAQQTIIEANEELPDAEAMRVGSRLIIP